MEIVALVTLIIFLYWREESNDPSEHHDLPDGQE